MSRMWWSAISIFCMVIHVAITTNAANSYPTSESWTDSSDYGDESRVSYNSQGLIDPANQAYNMFQHFMRNGPAMYIPTGFPHPNNFVPRYGGVPDFRQFIPVPPTIPAGSGGQSVYYTGNGEEGVAVRASSADGKPVFRSATLRGPNSYGTAFAYSN